MYIRSREKFSLSLWGFVREYADALRDTLEAAIRDFSVVLESGQELCSVECSQGWA